MRGQASLFTDDLVQEAKIFLDNCPYMAMDGIPCENHQYNRGVAWMEAKYAS